MASDSHNRAVVKYAKNHYKRVPLDLTFEKYEIVKNAATAAGESVNGYIKAAIDLRLDSSSEETANG